MPKRDAPAGYAVRRYVPTDWGRYLDLDIGTRAEVLVASTAVDVPELRKARVRRLRLSYGFTPSTPPAYPPHQIFVIEKEKEYAGHLWVTDRNHPLTDEPILSVTSVAVDPRYRREGLGRYLLGLAETLARARGVGQVILQAATANAPARKLFDGLGYGVETVGYHKALKEE